MVFFYVCNIEFILGFTLSQGKWNPPCVRPEEVSPGARRLVEPRGGSPGPEAERAPLEVERALPRPGTVLDEAAAVSRLADDNVVEAVRERMDTIVRIETNLRR